MNTKQTISQGDSMHGNSETVKSTDEYFDDVNAVWRRVPLFWVGDIIALHSHKIKGSKE
ncbi:MAG: hypothetical protein IMZ58_11875 [Thermoplasmata archaeon]|nr:hypothetical protein [Thermoplasmata archaeon]